MTTDAELDLDPLLVETARSWLAQGWRIESRLPGQIVIVSGKPVNHILHLILTLVTLGLWAIVWLILAIVGGERRRVIEMDHNGVVVVRKARR